MFEFNEINEINNTVVNIFLLHILVSSYALFHFNIFMESSDKSLLHSFCKFNKDEYKLLIKTKLKLIINEQILFRVYLVELMMYVFNMNIVAPLWSILFATFYITYYNSPVSADINLLYKYSKFVYNFILSYFILINCSLLMSCIVHCYAEMLVINIRIIMFNKFNDIKTPENKKFTIKNNLKDIMPEKLELASKKEVEDMLSGKKFD